MFVKEYCPSHRSGQINRVKKEIINSRCSFYRGVQAYYTEVSVTRESIILPASRKFSTHYSFLCVCMKKIAELIWMVVVFSFRFTVRGMQG